MIINKVQSIQTRNSIKTPCLGSHDGLDLGPDDDGGGGVGGGLLMSLTLRRHNV